MKELHSEASQEKKLEGLKVQIHLNPFVMIEIVVQKFWNQILVMPPYLDWKKVGKEK